MAGVGNRQRNYTNHATNLRDALIGDNSGYDMAAPPLSWRTKEAEAQYTSEAGTDVSLQIRFFKIESVDLATGKLRVRVWWRMSWAIADRICCDAISQQRLGWRFVFEP